MFTLTRTFTHCEWECLSDSLSFDIRKSAWVTASSFLEGKKSGRAFTLHPFLKKHSWNKCGNLLVTAHNFNSIYESTVQKKSMSKQYEPAPKLKIRQFFPGDGYDPGSETWCESARASLALLPLTHTKKMVRSCTLHPGPGHSAFKSDRKGEEIWVLTSSWVLSRVGRDFCRAVDLSECCRGQSEHPQGGVFSVTFKTNPLPLTWGHF